MPFDGLHFDPRRDDPQRRLPPPNRGTAIILFLLVGLVVAPLTLTAVLDGVKYYRYGHWLSRDGSSWPGTPRPLTRWPAPKA